MRYSSWTTSPAHRVPDVQAEDHLGHLPPGQLAAGGYSRTARSGLAGGLAGSRAGQAGRTGAVAGVAAAGTGRCVAQRIPR